MGAAASAQTSEPFLFGTTLRSIPNATSSLGEGNPVPVDGRYWFADIPMAENMFSHCRRPALRDDKSQLYVWHEP